MTVRSNFYPARDPDPTAIACYTFSDSNPPQIAGVAGVYRIRNTINGKVYVGSALNLHDRMLDHWEQLQNGTHHNRHLLYAYNKYGKNALVFEPLEEIAVILGSLDREQKLSIKPNLLFWEQVYIDNYRSEPERCYNHSPTAGNSLGVKYTDEAKAKISAKAKGRISWTRGLTKETDPRVAAYADKRRGYKFSEEDKAKMRRPHRGLAERNRSRRGIDYRTPEHAEKMLSAIRGKPFTAEHKARIQQKLLGREFSDEHRARLKESQNKPETSAQRSASLLLYYARALVREWT